MDRTVQDNWTFRCTSSTTVTFNKRSTSTSTRDAFYRSPTASHRKVQLRQRKLRLARRPLRTRKTCSAIRSCCRPWKKSPGDPSRTTTTRTCWSPLGLSPAPLCHSRAPPPSCTVGWSSLYSWTREILLSAQWQCGRQPTGGQLSQLFPHFAVRERNSYLRCSVSCPADNDFCCILVSSSSRTRCVLTDKKNATSTTSAPTRAPTTAAPPPAKESVTCWMDIIAGTDPNSRPVENYLTVGQEATLVVKVRQPGQ